MYLDDHEEGTGGTDSDLSGWEHAGDLGDLEDLDESVQRRDSTIAPFRLRGLCSHRRVSWKLRTDFSLMVGAMWPLIQRQSSKFELPQASVSADGTAISIAWSLESTTPLLKSGSTLSSMEERDSEATSGKILPHSILSKGP